MWCVGEFGLDYFWFDVGYCYGGIDSEVFYQFNFNCMVLVLQDDENLLLWEIGVIFCYLVSCYVDDVFWLGELLVCIEVDCWVEWLKQNIVFGFMMLVFWCVVCMFVVEWDLQVIVVVVMVLE